jgi:hypothetical protein
MKIKTKGGAAIGSPGTVDRQSSASMKPFSVTLQPASGECTCYSEANIACRPRYNGGFSIQHFTNEPGWPQSLPLLKLSRQNAVAALTYVNGKFPCTNHPPVKFLIASKEA